MNTPQMVFVVSCGALTFFGSAALIRRQRESYREALVAAAILWGVCALLVALSFGLVDVYLWLGEVKP